MAINSTIRFLKDKKNEQMALTSLRTYHSPHLLVFGSIQNLTAGGSGPTLETNPGGQCKGNISNDPNKTRC